MQLPSIATGLLAMSIFFIGLANTNPVPARQHVRRYGWPERQRPEAVYLMNNLAENAVIAISVADDGTLASIGSTTPTGGAGGNQVNTMTGQKFGPDALASQASVNIAGNVRSSFRSSTPSANRERMILTLSTVSSSSLQLMPVLVPFRSSKSTRTTPPSSHCSANQFGQVATSQSLLLCQKN